MPNCNYNILKEYTPVINKYKSAVLKLESEFEFYFDKKKFDSIYKLLKSYCGRLQEFETLLQHWGQGCEKEDNLKIHFNRIIEVKLTKNVLEKQLSELKKEISFAV